MSPIDRRVIKCLFTEDNEGIIVSLYNPHTSETDLGRIKFLSHNGLLAECILWTRRVHVKIHDSSAIYASTRRVYILTRRVAHSSYF